MALLLASLAAIVVAPLVYRWSRPHPAWLNALDGFILTAIAGLVGLHVLPHAVEQGGLVAVLPAVLGFLLPSVLERRLHAYGRAAHRAAGVLALVGLMVHAGLDGAALYPSRASGHEVDLLPVAVVLHRLPESLAIWWLLAPGRGPRLALTALGALGLATVGGYLGAGALLPYAHTAELAWFQALVGGALLHVVVHRTQPAPLPLPRASVEASAGGFDSAQGRNRPRLTPAGLGALAGVVLLWLLSGAHRGQEEPVGSALAIFFRLAAESAPALLLALAMAGLVKALLPQASLDWLSRGSAPVQALRGMAFGLPLPICSCGVIPLYRSLVERGVPATAALAFLIATPELGLDAVLLSIPLLGLPLALTRVLAAALVAFLVGWGLGLWARRGAGTLVRAPVPASAPRPLGVRLAEGLRFGATEMVDEIGPWLALGLALAAIVEPMLRESWLVALPGPVQVGLFALLGLPTYVCASGATPLVAVLIATGVSPGAALAFLLTGPATNVTTFGVLQRLHGRALALGFGLSVATLAIAAGLVVNALLPRVAPLWLPQIHQHDPGALTLASVAVLTALILLSLLRQGPRGFLGQILPVSRPHGHDEDGHEDHENGCCSAGRPEAPSLASGPGIHHLG